ncbi:hypothetical protein NitYY0918_C0771 [Nitratiruptor sp. YY09-18]|nr:hypothetical protein NitYY0918_C0771 [Nitratiruptor sp. YY09-18]
MNWLEERRYEWIPLAADAIARIIDGFSVLVLTDDEHEWFCRYVVTSLNKPNKNRPFIPVYDLKRAFPATQFVNTNQDVEFLFDMLSISFEERFFIWYIGRSTSRYVKIAKRSDDSFLWIMDEDMQNNFTLKSYDDLLDVKLIQLFRLFDKSIDAAIFGEIDLAI